MYNIKICGIYIHSLIFIFTKLYILKIIIKYLKNIINDYVNKTIF